MLARQASFCAVWAAGVVQTSEDSPESLRPGEATALAMES